MPEIDHIIEELRRKRQRVEDEIGERTNSQGRTEDIIRKLEELRRRSEAIEGR